MLRGTYKLIYITLCIFIAAGLWGAYFYPKQIMPQARKVNVLTPQIEKYHNDCLHPCIRKDTIRDTYWMVQSPYYKWNSKCENPILYSSDSLDKWENGVIVADTPEYGFNSDPNIFLARDTVFVFWREFATPLCDSLGTYAATVGVWSVDGLTFSEKKVYLVNEYSTGDTEQAPTLILVDGKYRFYATWYQYEPERINRGISIWEGSSLTTPDFKLIDTVKFNSTLTVDKLAQKKIFGKLRFIPKPLKFDLWHFDLVEYDNKLFMVSSSEKGDNVMFSVSKDGVHFKIKHTPLVNNHYSETYVGYRQYYYKPTAIIENGILHLFYTTNDKDSPKNILLHSEIPVNKL